MNRIWQRPATSRGARFFMVLVVTLAMGLPLYLISKTTEDREEYRRVAAAEITDTWGGPQTIVGPVLVVPVADRSASTDPASQRVWSRQVILLPDSYNATARIDAELRNKGIFTAPVYSATIDVTADFATAIATARFADQEAPLWEQTTLTIALTNTRGLRAHPVASWDGSALALAAVASMGGLAGDTIGATIGDPRGNGGKAVMKLVVAGSQRLAFIPVGRDSMIHATSNWRDPGFDGDFLPNSRTVGDAGFEATWSVPQIARGFVQRIEPAQMRQLVSSTDAGVTLVQTVDLYRLMQRAMKYGLFFVGLALLTVFVVEVTGQRAVHAAQYVMIGLAKCVFFLLLLSLGEQIGFLAAYATSSVATIALVCAYGRSALALGRRIWLMAAALTGLYGVLFALLQSPDLALLSGSLFAFAAIAITMFATRHIDWWASGSPPGADRQAGGTHGPNGTLTPVSPQA
ncbi:MAG: cell envelope integrity protein CreD [Alphaproteobacteria bacterium]